jgi:SP family sugar:H+ symporter-like MFS transporter
VQLFITLGIFTANCVNFGTEKENSARAWRLPMGIGFLWPAIMVVGMFFMQESPRWDYRQGNHDSARATIARSYGLPEVHPEVNREINEIKAKLDAESGADHPWYEIFTGPRMLYRTLLGCTLQMLQQLTGANCKFLNQRHVVFV